MEEITFSTFNIISLSLFNLIVLLIFLLFIFKYIRCHHHDDILNKVNSLPMPIMIIDYKTNNIYNSNEFISNMFNKEEVNKCNLSSLNIFKNFNDYINIKKMAEESTIKHDQIYFNIESDSIILDITYTLIKLDNKKYIIISLDDKTKLINYIKYLGIFASIIDNSNEGVIISKFNNTNSDPEIIYINEAITNITEFKSEDLLSKPLIKTFFKHNVISENYDDIKSSVLSFKPASIECEYTKKNGEKCWVVVDIIAINKNNIIDSLNKLDTNNYMYDNIDLNQYNIDLYVTVRQTDVSSYKSKEFVSKLFFNQMQQIAEDKIRASETLTIGLMQIIKNKDENKILNLLNIIGDTLTTDRVYIVKFFTDDQNKKYSRYIYKWSKFTTDYVNDELINNVMNSIDGYNIYANFLSNRTTSLYFDEIKNNEIQKIYKLLRVKSSILCPIFKDNQLIGFIGADECQKFNRIWDFNSENIIRIVAENLGDLI